MLGFLTENNVPEAILVQFVPPVRCIACVAGAKMGGKGEKIIRELGAKIGIIN